MARAGALLFWAVGGLACGSSAADPPAATAVGDAGAPLARVAATSCSCDSDCPSVGASAGVCVYGVCMAKASAEACSAPGSTDECPAGSRCWPMSGAALCFPDCGDGQECAGTCDRDGACVQTKTSNCDPSCGSFCRKQDEPCGEKATEGRCTDGAACQGGTCISKGCADWRCKGAGCLELIAMPGATQADSPEALASGYFIASKAKYSFLRRDLTMLIQYAACEVRYRFADTTPIGLADLSQQDGKTPGTDVGNPGHATSTHRGDDIDIAYYQTDGANNPQIICGDGTDKNPNGVGGKYNDGAFCTTADNIIDWPRELWLFAKFSESPKARVFGIDETLAKKFMSGAAQLRKDGDVSADIAERMTHVGYGNAGGWAFHHHHSHMSFFR